MMDEWTRLVFSSLVVLVPLNLPGLPYSRLQQLSGHLETMIRTMIAERRTRGAAATDVLGALLGQVDDQLSEDALIGQTNFLFTAGHLTTASAMAWTLFCLMAHPDLIGAVVAESAALEASDLLAHGAEVTLTEAVINEALRLFPPVVWWMRIAKANFSLGGYVCPADTRIIHSPYMSHRDPVHFVDPYSFNPRRWFDAKPAPFAFCPFSAGPRMCLGERVAIAEIRLLLKCVLERFTPAFPEGANIHIGGLMLSRPSPGLFAWLKPPGSPARRVRFTGTVHTAFRHGDSAAWNLG
jgi:cytochrome P450